MPPSALPLQFQLHVKLLLTSWRTLLHARRPHRVKSHHHKPQLQVTDPQRDPVCSNSPTSCEEEGAVPSGFSLLYTTFLSPKICWCGQWSRRQEQVWGPHSAPQAEGPRPRSPRHAVTQARPT